MIINFRARGISRGACKLARTPTLIKEKHCYDSQDSIKGELEKTMGGAFIVILLDWPKYPGTKLSTFSLAFL
jgi:hypothetical protein